jgi:hypothetical protein
MSGWILYPLLSLPNALLTPLAYRWTTWPGKEYSVKLDKKTAKRLQEIDRLKEDDKNHFFSIVDAFLRDATARKAYASLTTRAASLRLLLLIAIFFPFLFYSRY